MFRNLFKTLILLSLFTLASCSNELDDIPSNSASIPNSPSFGIEYVDQHQAIESFNNLMAGFETNKTNTKALDSTIYPDYYGGCYINENNDLVVYIVGDSIQSTSAIQTLSGDNRTITKVGRYSFNTLKEIMKTLEESAANEPNMAGASLMDMSNDIVVKLFDCSEDKINEFKTKIIDSPAIIFEKQDKSISLYSSIYPGATINCTAPFSLGYRVYLNGEEGYITAAHGVNLGQFIKIGQTGKEQFAKCTGWRWEGTLDAAFCTSTYIADYSKTIAYTSLPLGNSYGIIVAGNAIYKSGYASQNTQGYIISTSAFTSIEGKVITDLISSNCYCTYGDSGGITYTSTYGFEGNPVGIVHGGDGQTSYFVKATNIDNYFGCILDN